MRAAARYVAAEIPGDPALQGIRAALHRAGRALGRLDELVPSETRLLGELLDLLGELVVNGIE